MKKALFFLCLTFLFSSSKIIQAHGFGVHAAHLSSILALNDQYTTLIADPRYQPYFIYGSIFPDIQYAVNYKSILQNLYQKIREVKLYDMGWLGSAFAFDGLTYEISTDQIPDPDAYPFGIDTHSDKYGLAFAEYLLQQCDPIDPPGPNPGSNGTTKEHDARNMKLAFALGYYAHLSEDVACHDFMVPRITSSLDLGDLELIKNPQSFNKDPNAQLEGIIEGIMDHYYGSNNTIADIVYDKIWVSRNQLEPDVPEWELMYYGPVVVNYVEPWPAMNPVLLFFHEVLNTWYNTNPFNLPTIGEESYKKDYAPLSATGFYQLATVFRFVNRFYPAVAGQPFNGFNRLDEVLADWISNHLDLSDASNAIGISLSWCIAFFPGLILAQEFNVSCLSGLAYPDIRDGFTSELSRDSRSLVGLMLSDMSKADELATNYPDRINIESYNKLKNSILFTNPTSLLTPLWAEYKSLGTKIYNEVGPLTPDGSQPGKWYYEWSPWHKQSMAWGVLSSLNNSIPDIYTSNPNVAIYDAYFQVNGRRITGPEQSSTFNNNPNVKAKIELYNTSNIPSESITLKVKRDHNLTDYSLDPLKSSTTFTIDQDPLTYNTIERKKIDLTVPSVSLTELTNYRGYYMEAVKNSNSKAMFTSSFEQYQERLDLTPNYSQLYGSYDQGKWPVSLGLIRSVATVNLNAAQFPEGGGSGGNYLINGIQSTTFSGYVDDYINIQALPPQDHSFWKWSDENFDNPRTLRIANTNTNLYAIYKKVQVSNQTDAYTNNSQRKFLRTMYGTAQLNSVYESMHRIWYEASTDGGSTWNLKNNGLPLSSFYSSAPSISPVISPDNAWVLITFAEAYGNSSSTSDIRVIRMIPTTSQIVQQLTITDGFSDGIFNNPVVGTNSSNSTNTHFVLVYELKNQDNINNWPPGIYYRVGYIPTGAFYFEWLNDPVMIPNTDASSYTPTISTNYNHYSSTCEYKIAWEQRFSSTSSKIQSRNLSISGYSHLNNFTANLAANTIELSYGSGYQKNSAPSLITLNNGIVKAVWQGARLIQQEEESTEGPQRINAVSNWEFKTIYKDLSTGSQKTYGTKTNLPTINKLDDNSEFYFAYSEQSDLSGKVVKGYDLRTINPLDAYGKDVQIGNGTGENNTRANLFDSRIPVFYFSRSTDMGHVNKKNILAILSGREGVVYKDTAQFYFAVGDVIVDNQPVEFRPLQDTIQLNTKELINAFLETEPFTLTDNSVFNYSVQYGVTDSLAASLTLLENRNINFKVELLDVSSGTIISTFDNVFYSRDSVFQYNNIAYQVNTSGIGSMLVKLRLVINSSGEFNYSLTERIAEESVLGKRAFKQITLDGIGLVKEYALAQNYPNPFNPSTTIRYQIPQDGIVTLKIYDILGSEIKTLVNEQKAAGKYEVNFNASAFASGVYIYKIQAGSFNSSKKMILIK